MIKMMLQFSLGALAVCSISVAGTIDKEYLLQTSQMEKVKMKENDNAKTGDILSPPTVDKCADSCGN